MPEHELFLGAGRHRDRDARGCASRPSPAIGPGQVAGSAPRAIAPGLVDVVVWALPERILVVARPDSDAGSRSGVPAGAPRAVPAAVIPGLVDLPIVGAPKNEHVVVTPANGGGDTGARLSRPAPAIDTCQVARPA